MSTIEKSTTLTGTWKADPKHSSLGFAVRHSGVATIRGTLPAFEATLAFAEDGPRLSGVGRAASLTTGDPDRDVHLSAPDFFDTERYPELRFSSTSVERDDEQVVVRGELTIRGVSHPVELRGTVEGPVTDAFGNDRVGVELQGTIDRTTYGVSWNAPLPGGGFLLSDKVTLTASLSLVRGEV